MITELQAGLAVAARDLGIPLDDIVDHQAIWVGCSSCCEDWLAIVPPTDIVICLTCPNCGYVPGDQAGE